MSAFWPSALDCIPWTLASPHSVSQLPSQCDHAVEAVPSHPTRAELSSALLTAVMPTPSSVPRTQSCMHVYAPTSIHSTISGIVHTVYGFTFFNVIQVPYRYCLVLIVPYRVSVLSCFSGVYHYAWTHTWVRALIG